MLTENHAALIREIASTTGDTYFAAPRPDDRTSVEAFQATVEWLRELKATGLVELIGRPHRSTAFGAGLIDSLHAGCCSAMHTVPRRRVILHVWR